MTGKNTTRRTHLAALCSAGLAALAGCSGGTDSGTETRSETTRAERSTSTTDEDARDLSPVRAAIEDGFAALAAHDLVDEDGPNLALDHVEGFDVESVTDPAAAARQALSDVEGGGRADRLLALTRYLDAKADLYLHLIAAQVTTVRFKRRFADDETTMAGAYRTVDEANTFVERVPGYLDDCGERLDAVGVGAPQVAGFDPVDERTELDALVPIVGDLRGTIEGFRSYTGGFLTAGEASSALQAASYQEAATGFTRAAESMRVADERLESVADGERIHHASYIELFGCQTDDLATAFGQLAASARASREGDTEEADRLAAEARALLDGVGSRCVPGEN